MKKLIAMLLVLVICCSMLAVPASGADERTGITHERMVTRLVEYPSGSYYCEKLLDDLPVTMEAWVYLPAETYAQLGGTILGNKPQKNTEAFTFSIEENGVPQLAFGHINGEHTFTFTNAAVPQDTWTHVAVVYGTGTDGKQVYCYINGELKESSAVKNWFTPGEYVLSLPVCLAGDRQQMNFEGFIGTLGDVTAYKTVRTQAQILSDVTNGPDVQDVDLLMHYDLASATYGATVPDASGNGYDMRYEKMWLTQEERDAVFAADENEYTYSIAFIPDVQITTRAYSSRLKYIFDFLLDNQQALNIQYAISLGDLTDTNTDTEWETFSTQQNRLNGILPYSLIRGNHDITQNDYAPYYDQYFSVPGEYYYDHVKENGGFYDATTTTNTYLLFSVGDVDYIILNIDFAMTEGVFAWADDVLSKYSDRRAIVVTHGYIGTNGQLLCEEISGAPSSYVDTWLDPDDLWERVLRKHANVDLVACGHIGSDHIICSERVGDNGNVVHQMLSDTQYVDRKIRGASIVTMMHFTEDGRFARVEHYSAANKLYFRESNYDITLDFGAVSDTEQTPISRYCEHCKAEKTWLPMTTDFGTDASQTSIPGGHYYLPDNMTAHGKTIQAGNTVCLDLNGYTYTGSQHLVLEKGATFNLQGEDGVFKACGSNGGDPGGTVYIKAGATMNLYSGTVSHYESAYRSANNGGVLGVYGSFNMYGGTVTGGVATNVGGSVFVDSAASFYMEGGEILCGSAATSGDCVYARGKIVLSGDVYIEQLMANPKSGSTTVENLLTIRGNFTGTVCLSFSKASTAGVVMGISENADLSGADIYYGSNDLRIKVDGNTLVTYMPNAADVITASGECVSYDTLQEALTAVQEGETLVLKNSTTAEVTVPESIVLDLGGRKIDNTLTAAEGKTVYVKDSATADYRIGDGVYGKVKAISGNVLPAQATATEDAYLQTMGSKYLSYHAVKLNIEGMSLRPGNGGLYYTNAFAGDTMVRERVVAYGIALNITQMPNADNMETTTVYSKMDGVTFGDGQQITGTLLTGILKTSNTETENLTNGGISVYGRAYIQLEDGTYLFGATCARSLREQLIAIDARLDSLTQAQKDGLRELYSTYPYLTEAWNLHNIPG